MLNQMEERTDRRTEPIELLVQTHHHRGLASVPVSSSTPTYVRLLQLDDSRIFLIARDCSGSLESIYRRRRINGVPLALARPRALYSGHAHCRSSLAVSLPRRTTRRARQQPTTCATTATHRHGHQPTPQRATYTPSN